MSPCRGVLNTFSTCFQQPDVVPTAPARPRRSVWQVWKRDREKKRGRDDRVGVTVLYHRCGRRVEGWKENRIEANPLPPSPEPWFQDGQSFFLLEGNPPERRAGLVKPRRRLLCWQTTHPDAPEQCCRRPSWSPGQGLRWSGWVGTKSIPLQRGSAGTEPNDFPADSWYMLCRRRLLIVQSCHSPGSSVPVG